MKPVCRSAEALEGELWKEVFTTYSFCTYTYPDTKKWLSELDGFESKYFEDINRTPSGEYEEMGSECGGGCRWS